MLLRTLVLIAPLLFFSRGAIAADTKPLRLAADPWCPYTCDPQIGFRGLITDVATEVLEGMGKEVKYEIVAWNKAIEDARAGKHEAILGAAKGDAKGFIYPETPIAYQKSCFYRARSARFAYENIASLKGKKIGVVAGYKYGEPLDGFIAANPVSVVTVEGVNTSQKLFALLKDKKVDILVEDESVVTFLGILPNEPLKGIDFAGAGCLEKIPVYIAFSPRFRSSRELAKGFDRGFEKLRESSRMKELLDRYSPRRPSSANP